MSGRVQGRVASGVGRAAVLVVVVTAALAGVPRAGAAEGAEPGVAGPAPEAPAPAEAPGDPTRGGWDGFLDPLRDAEARVTAAQARVERRTKSTSASGSSPSSPSPGVRRRSCRSSTATTSRTRRSSRADGSGCTRARTSSASRSRTAFR